MAKVIKLDCGTTMIFEHLDYVRSASLGIWVKAGSVFEEDCNNGVSHYLEHMMFKGTENRTAMEIAQDFDKIGSMSNAFTGKEATCYYVKCLSSNIYKGAEILLDMLLNSRFDTVEMDKERQVILEELKMVTDSPDDLVFDTISEVVNSWNPLHRSILGTEESLNGIDRDVLYSYYSSQYAREGIVIAVAGNFDEERITELFERRLEKLNRKLPVYEYSTRTYSRNYRTIVKDIEQTHLCLAVPGVSSVDDRYYAFVLMNSIFGGSMSSRLFQNIREQKGLAYSVSSLNAFSSKSGFFNIYAGVAHDKIKLTIDEIRKEINLLASDGVTEEELSMAKEQVKSTNIFSLENTSTLMFSLGRNLLLNDRVFSPDEQIEKFNSVTRADIIGVAEMIADFDSYSGVAVTGTDFDLGEMIK